MKIGLFGFSFEDRNKGCEALTYSFISILDHIVPKNLEIVNLSGIGRVEKVAKRFPTIKFTCVGFQKSNISIHSFKELLECDVVFDCTFGDNFSDIYSLPFVSRTTNYKEMTLFLKQKLIIAPQTIGPFKDEKLKKRVGKVLRKAEIVFSRDQASSDCVRELSGIEPITVTDLAFVLPYDKARHDSQLYKQIGINVSGLLWRGGFNNNNQFGLKVDYQQYIDSVVKWCQSKKFSIHFIPHVLSHNESEIDEDFRVCAELAKKYGEKLAPFFEDPIEAKSYIACMDAFIGARMHSTIAAFSSGVVTIPFSYSRKFEGLFNSVGYNYTINARDLGTEEAINKTIAYIENAYALKKQQVESMQRIDTLLMLFNNKLEHLINSL